MTFSTKGPVGRAKGLGSAHEGTTHWWLQRVTAVALLPLTLWFVMSIAAVAGKEREVVISWFGDPLSAIALSTLMVAGIYHAVLGIQVVIEDYVSCEWRKLLFIWIVRFLGFFLSALAVVSTLVMVLIRFMGTD